MGRDHRGAALLGEPVCLPGRRPLTEWCGVPFLPRPSVGHPPAALCLEPGLLSAGRVCAHAGHPEPAPGNCLQVSAPCICMVDPQPQGLSPGCVLEPLLKHTGAWLCLQWLVLVPLSPVWALSDSFQSPPHDPKVWQVEKHGLTPCILTSGQRLPALHLSGPRGRAPLCSHLAPSWRSSRGGGGW